MSRITDVVLAAQKKANTWRAFWILLVLGLAAVGGAAPDGWGIP